MVTYLGWFVSVGLRRVPIKVSDSISFDVNFDGLIWSKIKNKKLLYGVLW